MIHPVPGRGTAKFSTTPVEGTAAEPIIRRPADTREVQPQAQAQSQQRLEPQPQSNGE